MRLELRRRLERLEQSSLLADDAKAPRLFLRFGWPDDCVIGISSSCMPKAVKRCDDESVQQLSDRAVRLFPKARLLVYEYSQECMDEFA